ncbi:PINIT domain-containing protein [Trametes gibbosa]|nr:PINIT domain-containing protein [Trametes gibbosa]
MANQDAWADFETLRHNLKSNKVEQLKQILTGLNEECHTNLTKSGKKQDLIDKITRELDQWRRSESAEYWMRAKGIMQRVRQTGYYTPRPNGEPSYTQTHNYPPPPAVAYQPTTPSSSSIPRYDPYAPPRRPPAPAPTVASSSTAPAPPPPPSIRFKYSPFFKVDRLISSIVECPESTSSMDRRSSSLSFSLTTDIIAKLNSSAAKYQLRLYCTSSTFYSPPGPFRSPITSPCPIEFPPTCEVRVNGAQLNANLKGLKKRPGTAPPPDLGKATRLAFAQTNRVEMIYVNSQQPTAPKKYYLAVMLVEVTSVDQLIGRLRKGKYRPRAEILADMQKAIADDDEIVAGHQKMSLKCPLSYMRIATPCRSASCVHPQCFDALSWFSVMEQTTTWMCPVCEKVLNVEDLIIDGYFDDILKNTPEDVEDVIVEADGQWHSEDNKFGSAEWTAVHPPAVKKPASPVKRAPSPVKPATGSFDKPRPSNAEIVILDSDEEDEDEGRVKRELSPSADSARLPRSSQSVSVGSSQPSRSQVNDIIDLTLDSEDEDLPPPRPSPITKKRKETDDLPSPTEQIWKKSRTDGGPSSSSTAHDRMSIRAADLPMPPHLSASSRNSASHSSSRSSGGSQPYIHPSAPPLSINTLPRRPTTATHDNFRNTLPPLSSYPPRGSGAGGSSAHNWR